MVVQFGLAVGDLLLLVAMLTTPARVLEVGIGLEDDVVLGDCRGPVAGVLGSPAASVGFCELLPAPGAFEKISGLGVSWVKAEQFAE